MRTFRFSLQVALVVRERAVEQAETALRSVQEEWNRNQRRQEEIVAEVRGAELAVEEGPVEPVDYVALDRYRAESRRRRGRLVRESVEIGSRLAARKAAWQTAERDRTLLVRLREKSLKRWQADYDRELQQLAEEAYLSRWPSRPGRPAGTVPGDT